MKKFTISPILFFAIFIVLLSCNEKSRETLIIGKWQSQEMNTTSRDPNDEDKKGIEVEFTKDGTCIAFKEDNEQWKGTYSLINKDQAIATHMLDPELKDTVKILSLSETILQILTSDKDTAEFRKIGQ